SDENPVYYIQYAHARICSMLNQSPELRDSIATAATAPLVSPTDLALMRRLAGFPGLLAPAANDLAPPQLAFWLRECAAECHAWASADRVLVDDETLKLARLRLAAATRRVIANGLGLLGVSAPERM